jgi:Na+/proline symporter
MIEIILLIIIAICITIIYDARDIIERYFSSVDLNKQAKVLKIIGTIVAIACALGLYFLIRR